MTALYCCIRGVVGSDIFAGDQSAAVGNREEASSELELRSLAAGEKISWLRAFLHCTAGTPNCGSGEADCCPGAKDGEGSEAIEEHSQEWLCHVWGMGDALGEGWAVMQLHSQEWLCQKGGRLGMRAVIG